MDVHNLNSLCFKSRNEDGGATAMSDSSKPFAPKKLLEIKGRRMACIDEGQGAPFPPLTSHLCSSYEWPAHCD
jgi:hypothetical protein